MKSYMYKLIILIICNIFFNIFFFVFLFANNCACGEQNFSERACVRETYLQYIGPLDKYLNGCIAAGDFWEDADQVSHVLRLASQLFYHCGNIIYIKVISFFFLFCYIFITISSISFLLFFTYLYLILNIK